MDDATLAQAVGAPLVCFIHICWSDPQLATPVGLNNLGNTCYMNATIQTLRAIPELQTALDSYQPGSSTSGGDGLQGSNVLTRSMKNMYNEMKKTTDAYTPMAFLAVLRQVVPQFGEVSNVAGMRGYAQQGSITFFLFFLSVDVWPIMLSYRCWGMLVTNCQCSSCVTWSRRSNEYDRQCISGHA